MKTLNQLKTALLSMGLGEIQVEKVCELAQELLDTRTQEMLADVQRLTTERNGWQKQAEAQIQLRHDPDLDAVERANRRAELAEARLHNDNQALHNEISQLKEAVHVAEERLANAEEVKRLAVEDRGKVRDQRDEAIARVKQLVKEVDGLKEEVTLAKAAKPANLSLFIQQPVLPVRYLEVFGELLREGSVLELDGESYRVAASSLCGPSLNLWRISADIEVADE